MATFRLRKSGGGSDLRGGDTLRGSTEVVGSFTVAAIKLRTQTGSFSVDAVIVPRHFTVDAIVRRPNLRQFLVAAIIGRGFTVSAWIVRGGSFTADAVIVGQERVGSLTADAWIAGTGGHFSVDAWIKRGQSGAFTVAASLVPAVIPRTGSFTTDAWVVGTPGSFTVDAQISAPSTPTGSFAVDAVVSLTYRHASFAADAVVRREALGQFLVAAVISTFHARSGSFTADAYIARHFTVDAVIARSFSVDAVITQGHGFTVAAVVQTTGFGFFSVDAVVARGAFRVDAVVRRASGGSFDALAVLHAARSGSFTVSAYIYRHFTVDAFIVGTGGSAHYFAVDAFIVSPTSPGPGGGPPPGGGGNGRSGRIVQVLIDGADVTGDTEFGMSTFTQAARTQPGQFTLVLRGATAQHGGEEVLVNIDGFRQYGGFVVNVSQRFATEDATSQPQTVLTGLDFNVLFDRIVIWNAEKYGDQVDPGHAGAYDPIPPLPAGTTDQDAILAYWHRFIDMPWKRLVDVHAGGTDPHALDGVDFVAIASPEEKVTFESGHFMREFMQRVSRQTNGVWWIDPYYTLQYHRRSNATAPFALTDGSVVGTPTRALSVQDSIADITNDALVWGTLAQTIEGKVVLGRDTGDQSVGLWQWAEFRSDVHLQSHVDQRAKSIIQRKVERRLVTATIFEKGFQAGMVATVHAPLLGIDENIVIREITMSFPVAQGNDGNGNYYSLVQWDLSLGLDPEDPWDFYDMLPFEQGLDTTSFPVTQFNFPPFQIPHLQLQNEGKSSLGSTDICVDAPMSIITFRDDFDRPVTWNDPTTWGNGGCGAWTPSDLSSGATALVSVPPPWCVTLAALPGFALSNANFAASVSTGFAHDTLHWGLTSQQDDGLGDSQIFGSQVLPWGAGLPLFARVKRIVGEMVVAVWPQDGSHDAVVVTVPWANEVTLWPDALIDFSGQSQGIAVAAGGGGSGVVLNQGGVGAPPNTIEIDPQFGVRGFMAPDNDRTWLVEYTPPNHVAFFASPGSVVITQGSSGDASDVAWGVLDDAVDNPSVGQVYSRTFSFFGYDLPPNLGHLRLTGQVAASGIGNPLVFLDYMPNGVGVPFRVALSNYAGGGDFDSAAGQFAAGFVVPGNPSDPQVPVGYDATVAIDPTNKIQFTGAFSNVNALPGEYPVESPFNLYLNTHLQHQSLYWVASWGDPVPCGDDGPLGEYASCGSGAPLPFTFGWTSETVKVERDGSFKTTLPIETRTLQVYDKGLLLLPEANWTQVDNQNFKTSTKTRCVRVVYHAPPQLLGSHVATPRSTITSVPADNEQLPSPRPI
jgi:hypothetical protein